MYANLGWCKKYFGPPCSGTKKRWEKQKAGIQGKTLGYSFVRAS